MSCVSVHSVEEDILKKYKLDVKIETFEYKDDPCVYPPMTCTLILPCGLKVNTSGATLDNLKADFAMQMRYYSKDFTKFKEHDDEVTK